jgi:hypothetical protein
MKFKARLLSLLLVFALLLSGTALAVSDSTDNFVRTKSYAGQFSDLSVSSTFYQNVAALYEYGLSVGKVNGTFGLNDAVSVGQAVIFAARIRSLYRTGSAETGPAAFLADNMDVYQPYLLYLQSEGVLGNELDGFYNSAATRAQVAHLLANALPAAALPEINADVIARAYASRQYITDVTDYTGYQDDILELYRCGVSQGSDASGSFFPAAVISRGALAAMLTRMVDASLRVSPAWTVTNTGSSAEGSGWGSLILGDVSYIAAPSTAAEIGQDIAYMLASNSNVLTLQYAGEVPVSQAKSIMETALDAVKSYCEQCYNSVTCTYGANARTLVLTFDAASCTESQLITYRAYTLSSAISIHDQLWNSGAITADMTEYEKARVYYDWICQNCVYDYSASSTSISHIAYALFKNGVAVCDGYTGAYNLLLKLEGIDCYALSNADHIWTVATLDGVSYHIDTTWGDRPNASSDYTYFAMTEAQSRALHSW